MEEINDSNDGSAKRQRGDNGEVVSVENGCS
jgi:hypothetical protein